MPGRLKLYGAVRQQNQRCFLRLVHYRSHGIPQGIGARTRERRNVARCPWLLRRFVPTQPFRQYKTSTSRANTAQEHAPGDWGHLNLHRSLLSNEELSIIAFRAVNTLLRITRRAQDASAEGLLP